MWEKSRDKLIERVVNVCVLCEHVHIKAHLFIHTLCFNYECMYTHMCMYHMCMYVYKTYICKPGDT